MSADESCKRTAKEQGREPTLEELKEAFKKAKEESAIVGGEWFEEQAKKRKYIVNFRQSVYSGSRSFASLRGEKENYEKAKTSNNIRGLISNFYYNDVCFGFGFFIFKMGFNKYLGAY